MFWRREAAPVADPGRSHDGGAPDARPAAGSAPRPWGQWATLPALQRTVGPMPTTSRPTSFPDDLVARRPLQLTGVMAHVVDPAAPSGVVDGDGSLAAAPVQRSADVDLDLVGPAPVLPSRPRAAASDRGSLTVAPRPAGTAAAAVAVPASVAPASAPPASVAVQRAVAVQRSVGLEATAVATAPDAASAGVAPTSFPLVITPPVEERAGDTRADGSWSDSAATYVPVAHPSPPGPARPSPTAGGAPVQRRLGLGEPLSASSLPARPTPATTPAEPARTPVATGAESPVGADRPTRTDLRGPDREAPGVDGGTAGETAGALPVVAREVATAKTGDAAGPSDAGGVEPARTAGTPAPASASPRTEVQRSVEPGPDPRPLDVTLPLAWPATPSSTDPTTAGSSTGPTPGPAAQRTSVAGWDGGAAEPGAGAPGAVLGPGSGPGDETSTGPGELPADVIPAGPASDTPAPSLDLVVARTLGAPGDARASTTTGAGASVVADEAVPGTPAARALDGAAQDDGTPGSAPTSSVPYPPAIPGHAAAGTDHAVQRRTSPDRSEHDRTASVQTTVSPLSPVSPSRRTGASPAARPGTSTPARDAADPTTSGAGSSDSAAPNLPTLEPPTPEVPTVSRTTTAPLDQPADLERLDLVHLDAIHRDPGPTDRERPTHPGLGAGAPLVAGTPTARTTSGPGAALVAQRTAAPAVVATIAGTPLQRAHAVPRSAGTAVQRSSSQTRTRADARPAYASGAVPAAPVAGALLAPGAGSPSASLPPASMPSASMPSPSIPSLSMSSLSIPSLSIPSLSMPAQPMPAVPVVARTVSAGPPIAMPVATTAAPSSAAAAIAATTPTATQVAAPHLALDDGPPEPTAQRAMEPTAAAPEATQVAQVAPGNGPMSGPHGSSSGASALTGALTAAQVDDLARRLTPPLLRRLRAQLLLDRERLGVRTDV